MSVKNITKSDIGKWVKLRAKIVRVYSESADIEIEGNFVHKRHSRLPIYGCIFDGTVFEFTDPPAPTHEVGDVFKNLGTHPAEWTIAFIDGDACLMRYLTGHVSADYPLNPDLWEFVRKGTAS